MNTEGMRVAVVGAGSAGPAVGMFLARLEEESATQVKQVTIFEQAEEMLVVGAGFLLQPTGMRVLKELGVLKEVVEKTAQVDQLFCRNREGRVLLDLKYGDLEKGLFGAGTHRASLLSVLLRECVQEGVEVRWGQRLVDLERAVSGKSVLVDEEGRRTEEFDLVVIADGARSVLRGKTGIPYKVSPYPWGALWHIGEQTADFSKNTLWQGVDTTRGLAGFLPTGRVDEVELLSLFWSVRMDRVEELRGRPLHVWKDELLRLVPQAEVFLNQVESYEQLQTARYFDVKMKRWHGEGVVVLGDAGHALSPQLGQGVNLALMDASVLANCLREFPLESALSHYTARRKRHLGFYQWATRWTTPFFQSDYLPLGWVRDAAFPLANQIPWFRREMTRTMAGLKTGPFTSMK